MVQRVIPPHPSPPSPTVQLYRSAMEQEKGDSVIRHFFHLNLLLSMGLVSMRPPTPGHAVPVTSTMNRISEDPPKVIWSLWVDTSTLADLAIHMGLHSVHPRVPSLGPGFMPEPSHPLL